LLDLAPGVDLKHTTPEDIARTPVPHVAYLLRREAPLSKLKRVTARLRRKVGARLKAPVRIRCTTP
jgi:hypothetical protein